MADVEKVKQGCKCCDHPLGERKCKGCPYAHFLTPYCNIHLAHDALSVIEEQQGRIDHMLSLLGEADREKERLKEEIELLKAQNRPGFGG